jgi:Fusaric acid resistance protein-like
MLLPAPEGDLDGSSVDSVGPGAYVLRIDLVPRAWQLRAPVLPAVKRGLLAGIPVGAAMLLDLELDAPASGAISTGALLAGFVAFDAPARTRLVWQLLCAPAIGAAGALGVLTGEPGALAALTMAVFASTVGMSVAVSRRLAIAGLNCVLALLLGQGLSVAPAQAPDALLLGGAGAALQALVSAVAWTRDRAVEPIELAAGFSRARRAIAANLNLGSKSLRHALRWGTALGVGVGVYHVLDLGLHGYWVPLTVLFVLRPEPDETVERIAMRGMGTLAGLAAATPLAMLIGGLDVIEALAIAITAGLSFALLAIEYALFTAAITTFIILSAHALGQAADQAAGQRALATLIGLAIVAMAVALWGGRRDAA